MLTYQRNTFKTKIRDGTERIQEYGNLRYSRTESRNRLSDDDPLIIYRIEYDLQEKITIIT